MTVNTHWPQNNVKQKQNLPSKNSHQRAPKMVHQKATSKLNPSCHTNQVEWPPNPSPSVATAESTGPTEILSIHINDTQMSMYNVSVGRKNTKALFNSRALLSCISKWFCDRIWQAEVDQVIDTNVEPPSWSCQLQMMNSSTLDAVDYTSNWVWKLLNTIFKLSRT